MKKLLSGALFLLFLSTSHYNISSMTNRTQKPRESLCPKIMRALTPTKVLVGAALLVAYLNNQINPASAGIIDTVAKSKYGGMTPCHGPSNRINIHDDYVAWNSSKHFALDVQGEGENIIFEGNEAGCRYALEQFAKRNKITNLGKARRKLFALCPAFEEIYEYYTNHTKTPDKHDEL